MLSIDSEYNLLDKNGNVYILRSLCIDDASGIWLESISRLNPGFTSIPNSKRPVFFNRYCE